MNQHKIEISFIFKSSIDHPMIRNSTRSIENQVPPICNEFEANIRYPLKQISSNNFIEMRSQSSVKEPISIKKLFALFYSKYPPLPHFDHIEVPIGTSKDPLDIVEFEHIIYRTLRSEENLRKPIKFNQIEITMKDRNLMVDAICRFHYKLGVMTNTFYRFLGIFDKYLSIVQVPKNKLLLYACACFFIASKIEDVELCRSTDLIILSGKSFSQNELLNAEIQVTNTVSFETTFATPLFYLTQLMRIHKSSTRTNLLARYILEIMQSNEHFYGVLPALQASVAVMVTRILKGERQKWTKELAGYTQFTEEDLYPYALHVRSMLLEKDREETKFMRRKYSTELFLCVANIRIPSCFN